MKDLPIRPGEYLRQWLDSHHMSQADLCRLTGLTTKHMCHVVTGKSAMTSYTAVQIEQVTSLDAGRLMAMQARYDVARERRLWS